MVQKNTERGIIRLLILIFIAFLTLSYFGIDLEQTVRQPLFKKNISFTWRAAKHIWTDYLYGPIVNLFDKDDSESSSEN